MKCVFCRNTMTINTKVIEYPEQKTINARVYCPNCGASGPVVESINEGIAKKYAVTAYKLRGKNRRDYQTPVWLLAERGRNEEN